MTDKQALIGPRGNVKAGGKVSRESLLPLGEAWHKYALGAFFGSLDAVKALHEAVLPEWHFEIRRHYAIVMHPTNQKRDRRVYPSPSPARAWLLAILEALIAEAEE